MTIDERTLPAAAIRLASDIGRPSSNWAGVATTARTRQPSADNVRVHAREKAIWLPGWSHRVA
jgi:hypothetical protein